MFGLCSVHKPVDKLSMESCAKTCTHRLCWPIDEPQPACLCEPTVSWSNQSMLTVYDLYADFVGGLACSPQASRDKVLTSMLAHQTHNMTPVLKITARYRTSPINWMACSFIIAQAALDINEVLALQRTVWQWRQQVKVGSTSRD